METAFQRIGREQRERQEARAKREAERNKPRRKPPESAPEWLIKALAPVFRKDLTEAEKAKAIRIGRSEFKSAGATRKR